MIKAYRCQWLKPSLQEKSIFVFNKVLLLAIRELPTTRIVPKKLKKVQKY